MRKPRSEPSPETADGWHHIYIRTVNRELLFTDKEKALLLQLIHQVAQYTGLIVCTHSEMTTHPHLVVYVPQRENISDQEILRRYCALHPDPSDYALQRIASMKRSLEETGSLSLKERQRHLDMMRSKSRFMQLLNPRFAKLYNKLNKRIGPLWNERFRNQKFPDELGPLLIVSAYVDMNACRAGLCKDPKDYPFCGYAEALAGNPTARAGLMLVTGRTEWDDTESFYRKFILGRGLIIREGKAGLSQETYDEAMSQDGRLSEEQIRERQHKYLTYAGAIGSAPFVQSQIDLYRQQTGKGQRLKPYPVPAGIGLDGLYVMSRPRLRKF